MSCPRRLDPPGGWHHVLLRRLRAVLERELRELGPPRAGAAPNSSLHVVVWVLYRQTARNHGKIGERVGLTTSQVGRFVQAQQRGLSPKTERLARRLARAVV